MHCCQTSDLARGKKKIKCKRIMRYLFIVKKISVLKTIPKQLHFFFLFAPTVEQGRIRDKQTFWKEDFRLRKSACRCLVQHKTAEVEEVFLCDKSTQQSNSNKHFCQPRHWEQCVHVNVMLYQFYYSKIILGLGPNQLPLNTFPQNLV